MVPPKLHTPTTASWSMARITASHSLLTTTFLHESKGIHISLMTVSERMIEWMYPKYCRNHHFHQAPTRRHLNAKETVLGWWSRG